MKKTCILLLLVFITICNADEWEQNFRNPPPDDIAGTKRMSCFWWWLNGCVTPEAITKDLTAMKELGYGSAMLFDGNGSSQDGNIAVPPGPMFGSPEWIELFKHAAAEADRTGLKLHLMIMSGWNLGGPGITPEYAAKKLTHSAVSIDIIEKTQTVKLPQPPAALGYYKDIAVLAFPNKKPSAAKSVPFTVTASSSQDNFPASLLTDGNPQTYWVSQGTKSGEGASKKNPVEIAIRFEKEVNVDNVQITPRSGYGPKEVQLYAGEQSLKTFTMNNERAAVTFAKTKEKTFTLRITDSFDPTYPAAPRNVQIAELEFFDGDTPLLGTTVKRKPLNHFNIKIATSEFGGSAPDCRPLYDDEPDLPGDPDFTVDDVIDLTGKMDKDGTMNELPSIFPSSAQGKSWTILRIGCTLTGARTSTSSGQFQGLVLDHLRTEAFDFYWESTVKPILEAVKPFCGKTLQNLETDSWEAGGMNWTETFREDFTKRRGYDPLKYLPIVCGYIGKSRNDSNQFLADFRRTIGDLIADNHYKRFKERAAEYGLGTMPESGGPHGAPIDSLQLLGMSDVPMSEFWSWSPRHRIGDANRFFVKQPASSAHTNGKRFVAAEGLTNIGMYWQESFAENLKPSFDQAVCEGMNLLVWHTLTCSPVEAGLPGNCYFAGTYFNPQCTVWKKAKVFVDYVNRVDFMMQQGLPVADVLEFYGSGVPNFTQGEWANTAGSLPDYSYDVCSEDVLLNRIDRVQDGVIYLKDGVNYKLLVIPGGSVSNISPAAQRRIDELTQQGATVIKRSDMKTSRKVLQEKGVKADVKIEFLSGHSNPDVKSRIEWIHRKTEDADIYFIANLTKQPETVKAAFRVTGKKPELWDAVTGKIADFSLPFSQEDGVTALTFHLPSYASTFAVFRKQRTVHEPAALQVKKRSAITGSWTVEFQPPFAEEKPFTVNMGKLDDWSQSSDDRIRYFSGTAVYKTEWKTASLQDDVKSGSRLYLQFGKVGEFAEVKVNGKICGTVWSAPYQLDITNAVASDALVLKIEIEVANRWVNRLAGDARFSPDKRLTRTNITHITEKTPLMESGIIGPVILLFQR
ncbi:MAG: discoidin domain-containing protein [Planctomycetaceae bacterium]|jgi:hypothetical protein|nr:discoidin domain-containing protein [Planctomycetaceae bacterium]